MNYPLEKGRFLIEASAGTGKTFTITHLFSDLVLNGLPVSKILVTTFSKPAAAELKDRILEQLNDELKKRKKQKETKEAELADLQSGGAPQEQIQAAALELNLQLEKILLLNLAVSSIDEATIGTIHGFCQKMLRDYALDSGKSFAETLIPNDSEYRDDLVREFCRSTFYGSAEADQMNFDDLQKAGAVSVPGKYRIANESEESNTKKVFAFVHEALQKKKTKDGVLSFDDLIRDFHQALAQNPQLVQKVGQRYHAVFVDEFQDTDRMQFEIFDTCFPVGGNHLFYMIGDPKQSIYGFRGADIYAYLDAKKTAEQCFELSENFRSTPAMIEAVNRIFSDGDLSRGHLTEGVFLQEDIPYISVVSGREPDYFRNQQQNALRHRHYIGKKDNVEGIIYRDIVREIIWLLSESGMQIDTPDSEEKSRPVKASDIAILVMKHDQANVFQGLLSDCGIPASACKSGLIYDSPEAKIMQLLLHSFLYPEDQWVRGILLSPFFRIPGDQIPLDNSAETGKVPMDLFSEFLMQCGIEWRKHGLPSAFLKFLDGKTGGFPTPREKLFDSPNGERAITNYLQLMELLYEKESEENALPEDVLSYLTKAVNHQVQSEAEASTGAGADDRPDQLRLEGDSEAVQIMTMFAAKGLEFPVVFIPFPAKTAGYRLVSNSILFKKTVLDPESGEQVTILDFDKADAELKQFSLEEALRSQLRLLYVGLTRASYVTYLYTQEPPENQNRALNFTQSAQGVILTDPKTIPEKGAAYFLTCKSHLPEPLTEWFRKLQMDGEKNWTVFEKYPERKTPPVYTEPKTEQTLSARAVPTISDNWRVSSFSGFKARLTNMEDSEAEESPADHDAVSGAQVTTAAPEQPNTFRDFPRGALIGTIIHEIFEELSGHFSDFKTENGSGLPPRILSLIRAKLSGNGYDPDLFAEAAIDGISRTLRKQLPGLGLSLAELPDDAYTQEMEFFLNAPDSLDLQAIMEILRNSASGQVKSGIGRLKTPMPRAGLLNGQIDLIFESSGKYYIVDWKTNCLGKEDSDYTPEKIQDAMTRNFYPLQAYLYSAALLKMLRFRGIPDSCFGGVYYLFPRGISPENKNGIWFDLPPLDCLEKLLLLFQKEPVK